jgi:hypothetical protein
MPLSRASWLQRAEFESCWNALRKALFLRKVALGKELLVLMSGTK